jgi:hypothetical protein
MFQKWKKEENTLHHMNKMQTYSNNIREDFLGIIGQDPSVFKSNRLVIFRLFFIKFKLYPIDSSKNDGLFSRSLEVQPVIPQTPPVHL